MYEARWQIGFLLYNYADSNTFLRLYLTHVRSHLEYAAVVWDLHQAGLINKLKNAQKFALKAATKQWKANYNDLLNICQIPSPELCLGAHAPKAYGSRFVYLSFCVSVYVCNVDFSKVAKNQLLANAVQAQCDNISNIIVLDY